MPATLLLISARRRAKKLDDARAKANKYLAEFRVCKQCTADARGIPGRERGYQGLVRCPGGG